ncbi:MAG: NAD-dependent glutamate dehydrogenase [Amphiamblys sp. WSBS2006]|nr:MAG: NAD-dependent glutamate dehydrogenase [Amphiamblys sp. WSBS2006]
MVERVGALEQFAAELRSVLDISRETAEETVAWVNSIGQTKKLLGSTPDQLLEDTVVLLGARKESGVEVGDETEATVCYLCTENEKISLVKKIEETWRNRTYIIETHSKTIVLDNGNQQELLAVVGRKKDASYLHPSHISGEIELEEGAVSGEKNLRVGLAGDGCLLSTILTLCQENKLVCKRSSLTNLKGSTTFSDFVLCSEQEYNWTLLLDAVCLLRSLPLARRGTELSERQSLHEACYAHVGSVFTSYFLKTARHSIEKVHETVLKERRLLEESYRMFDTLHSPRTRTETQQRAHIALGQQKEIEKKIEELGCEHERQIFRTLLLFNSNVLRTNFFLSRKKAFSFRLAGDFLASEYPKKPLAVLLVCGASFHGFHVRFSEIARGGLRMIHSTEKTFASNEKNTFCECYELALTQHRKNKDIPEGGAKGVVLCYPATCDRTCKESFECYVDAVLDQLVTPPSEMVDYLGEDEILFLGPDEGTAFFMDWAAERAKRRGYRLWRSFASGKSTRHGGIPHAKHGATTLSINEYSRGIYRKLGLDERTVRKIQTGGPDGDLGSNEIKQTTDKTIAVVDVDGVLYDPLGLDREELVRLASASLTTEKFDKGLLSTDGFHVHVADKETSAGGIAVPCGLGFRNTFHLIDSFTADVFVPCGGRPGSVTLDNAHQLLDRNGVPRFKYIVEGANLFFTQEARLFLEQSGVILFKDATANKGGVISSSMEILAALALSESVFAREMVAEDGTHTPLYVAVVRSVTETIKRKARLEFEFLWASWTQSKRTRPISLLSDELSTLMAGMKETIEAALLKTVWKTKEMKRRSIIDALPSFFTEMFSAEKIVSEIIPNIPEKYVRLTVAAHLAGRFVYSNPGSTDDNALASFLLSYSNGLGESKKN